MTNGLFFIETLSIISCLFISYYDYRDQLIPMFLILIFTILSCAMLFFSIEECILINRMSSVLLIAYLLILLKGWEIYRRMSLLGLGDKILFPLCALWIPFDYISMFLILSGIYGVLIRFSYRKFYPQRDQKIPFAPALFASLWSTIILTLF